MIPVPTSNNSSQHKPLSNQSQFSRLSKFSSHQRNSRPRLSRLRLHPRKKNWLISNSQRLRRKKKRFKLFYRELLSSQSNLQLHQKKKRSQRFNSNRSQSKSLLLLKNQWNKKMPNLKKEILMKLNRSIRMPRRKLMNKSPSSLLPSRQKKSNTMIWIKFSKNSNLKKRMRLRKRWVSCNKVSLTAFYHRVRQLFQKPSQKRRKYQNKLLFYQRK